MPLRDPEVDFYLEKGIKKLNSNNPAGAKTAFLKALKKDLNNLDSLHLTGLAYNALNLKNDAIRYIEKAVEIGGGNPLYMNNLGQILRSDGQFDYACKIYERALEFEPENADILNNLGNTYSDLKNSAKAIVCFNRVIAVNPTSALAHFNLGNVYYETNNFAAAIDCFEKVKILMPGHVEAINNLGLCYLDTGCLDNAEREFVQVLALSNDFAEAHYNLGVTRRNQGNLDEAVKCMQTSLTVDPANSQFIDGLLDILNFHMVAEEKRELLATVQEEIQKESTPILATLIKSDQPAIITDETIQRVYQCSQSIIGKHELVYDGAMSQIFRGQGSDLECLRHMRVFETYNVIPEFCFGCFKVLVEPGTVVDLIKLMLLFDILELPKDNIRKCMIEIRPDISGTYKGYIYCGSLDEAKQIQLITRANVAQYISRNISVSVKRGCSEYVLKHPKYGDIKDDGPPLMAYVEEWRELENYFDKNLAKHKYPRANDTFNH